MLRVIAPEMIPHEWQAEELLRLGGFLDPSDLSQHITVTDVLPYKLCMPAANGSGKDQFIIAAFSVWFALKGLKNRTIITSASHDQLKSQTAPGILDLIERCNRLFGQIFKTVEFHYVCTLTASEIKLFATDEEGRAEGYHPWFGGQMAIVINEAKTVRMYGALRRCTGYAYWLEVSSPGPKSGDFYNSSLNAICYPALPILGEYYLRTISAYDCPHIPASHIKWCKENMTPEWFDSSVLAKFSDVGESVVITNSIWQALVAQPPAPVDDDIGIGLDTAGGGDENSCYVRQGNRVIHEFHFRQGDTTVTVDLIDKELEPWKNKEYKFKADDGGISHAIVDNLVKAGWRVARMLNQSPAINKREFLNLGAEMYFHLRRLVMRGLIIPHKEAKLVEQLTGRYYGRQDTTGKFKLESKVDARARGKKSPDRADAFVLCFAGYRPAFTAESGPVQPEPRRSVQEMIEDLTWNFDKLKKPEPYAKKRRTQQRYSGI